MRTVTDTPSTGAPAAAADATDVTLFMPTLIGGGAERIQLVLADYFLAQGLRVDVVVCKRFGALRDSVPAGARLVSLDARRVLLSLPRYERYLRSARPRVVISSVENASVIACLARGRQGARQGARQGEQQGAQQAAEGAHRHRLIVRQDNALVAGPSIWREPRRWAWLLLLAAVYRRADQLVAVSQGVEGQVRRLLGRSGPPVRCVYNPVITPDFEAKLGRDADLPEEAQWADPDAPLIAAAGRLNPVKDYPTLLRAFALLRQRMPARLVVMGEGEIRAELEALCGTLGIAADVRFTGFVANPLPVIRRADVFVLSSTSEGLGGVLIEALATGTPIVSTDCRHGPREVLRDGRYGRLVPVGDARALADAIGEALRARRPPPTSDLQDHLAQYVLEHVGRTYLSLITE